MEDEHSALVLHLVKAGWITNAYLGDLKGKSPHEQKPWWFELLLNLNKQKRYVFSLPA